MLDLPGYTLTEKFHDGSATVLYRGHRDSDGAAVVVKLPRSDFPTNREVGRIRHEYALLNELKLPGFAKAYALERVGRGVALVMEDLHAQPLSKLMRARQLTIGESLQVAIEIAARLEQLHAQGVVHKDIKPGNVLWNEQKKTVYLVDLGIASRATGELRSVIGFAALEGTLPYMSPEQTGRLPRFVDSRSDLYSLGVTLFELLTATLPFSGHDTAELIYSHVARKPPSPRQLRPELPEILAKLVLRLLNKAAEDRYQSARGLRIDLQHCLQQWQQSHSISDFPLGRFDQTAELHPPQRLYGRDAELARLNSALERVRSGAVELVLIHGAIGTGKTALASELRSSITSHGGLFLAERFEEQPHGRPLEPILSVMQAALRKLLTLGSAALAVYQQRLRDALGSLGQVLLPAIPELEQLIGPQPSVPAVGPQEAHNRFVLACQGFLRSLSSAKFPLMLFLDDIHFADEASLQLIKQLLLDPHEHHLLVVATYLDSAKPAPFAAKLKESLERERLPAHNLRITDLGLADVAKLLGDMLGQSESRVSELAASVLRKTHGNPFFIGQLVRSLRDQGVLRFDLAHEGWSWDLARLDGMEVTDNVAAFMLAKLARLPAEVLELLSAAACLGQSFELQQLAALTTRTPPACAALLAVAMQEGLVLQYADRDAISTTPTAGEDGGELASVAALPVHYRFTHDQLHSATYQRLEPLARQHLHLRIAEQLESQPGSTGHSLFDIVGHRNRAHDLLTSDGERLALARLNLLAGEQTMSTCSYLAAADYFEHGTAILGEDGWAHDRQLYFTLHLVRAQCEVLCGRLDNAHAELERISARPLSRQERGLVHLRLAELFFTRGEFAKSLEVGLSGLALFDIKFPADPKDHRAKIGEELSAIAVGLGSRRIADLADAPTLLDADLLVASELLSGLSTTIFVAAPELFPFLVLRSVRIAIEHGLSPGASYLFGSYAFFLTVALGEHSQAKEYAELALGLSQRPENVRMFGRVHVSFGMLWHRLHPLREALPLLATAVTASLAHGDFTFLSLAWQTTCLYKFDLSEDLNVLLAENDQALVVMKQTKDALSELNLLLCRQATAALLGKTSAPSSLTDAHVDEPKLVAQIREQRIAPSIVVYLGKRLLLDYLFGAQADTRALAREAADWELAVPGLKWADDMMFMACLHLLSETPSAAESEAALVAERIERYHQHFKQLAAGAPANYGFRERLIAAERARHDGRVADAIVLYDEAVAAVMAGDSPIFKAVVCERAALFHFAARRHHLAGIYLADAYYTYVRIGAAPKAEQLSSHYAQLLQGRARGLEIFSVDTDSLSSSTSSSLRGAGDRLDIEAVLQAAYAIADEIDLSRVVERVMRVVSASAGAQRGLLVLEQASGLCIEAVLDSDADQVATDLKTPIEQSNELPLGIIHYVVRTKEVVALGAASTDQRFAADPYLIERRPRSVLCVPLVHRGRLTGLLYLENNLTPVAFSRTRIELVRIIAAQTAISIENARLFRASEEASERTRRTNELLESQVLARTSELQSKNSQLEETNQKLQREFEERSRAERERSAIQEQMLRAQQERVAELSSPLIPITDHIVVMPLIGSMDSARAALVLEAVLEGVQRLRVAVVILDITGLRMVDTATAEMLLRTARALRLLGAQALLTGIRAEVAQTLVALGVDLGLIQTRSNLQTGIAYALQLTSSQLSGPSSERAVKKS